MAKKTNEFEDDILHNFVSFNTSEDSLQNKDISSWLHEFIYES